MAEETIPYDTLTTRKPRAFAIRDTKKKREPTVIESSTTREEVLSPRAALITQIVKHLKAAHDHNLAGDGFARFSKDILTAKKKTLASKEDKQAKTLFDKAKKKAKPDDVGPTCDDWTWWVRHADETYYNHFLRFSNLEDNDFAENLMFERDAEALKKILNDRGKDKKKRHEEFLTEFVFFYKKFFAEGGVIIARKDFQGESVCNTMNLPSDIFKKFGKDFKLAKKLITKKKSKRSGARIGEERKE